MRDQAKKKRNPDSSQVGSITTRDQAIKETHLSMTSAMGPLVYLLEVGHEEKTTRREVVAERLGATFSQMGWLFVKVSRERRECAISRVAPQLRHMVPEDSGDEDSSEALWRTVVPEFRTRNETLKALREAGQFSPPAEDPAAPRARNVATGSTSRVPVASHRQPFYARGPFSYRGSPRSRDVLSREPSSALC
ncbi:uncharacterized protein LOC120847904 [Ixodes scapularis]|uniref:uncharacterized protein LOC120847904 n=1 Tax=Ixodes scapularis TaxID=6945 RepID=UPI001A9F54AB|nr:uncharacterized protein LOC120847904 [Ixodes scapularis]